MQPKTNSGFDPNVNPFAAIMQQGGGDPMSSMMGGLGGDMGAGMPQGPAGGPQGAPQGIPQGGMMGMMGKPEPSVLDKGATGDQTKPLLAAIQNLHAYIALTTDVQEVNMIRKLISLLTNMVARDQQRALQNPANQQPSTPTAPQPKMGMDVSGSQPTPQG